jgi:hypothetical protein
MSIMRFRAQIKQPARMVFIFMSATIGVCCGAGEFLTTIIGTVILCAVALMSFRHRWFLSGASISKSARAVAEKSKKSAEAEVASELETAPPDSLRHEHVWGGDFVRVPMASGERLRVFVIVDETRGTVLSAVPDFAFSPWSVIAELERQVAQWGRPTQLVIDSWPEFGAKVFTDWARTAKLQIMPFSPAQQHASSIINVTRQLSRTTDSSNGFDTITTARLWLDAWRVAHNAALQQRSSEIATSDTVLPLPDRRVAS